jgi:glycosyltransferase involved in cell wall biosynthesis
VDDCSSDDTEQACQPWLSDPRVRYVRNASNLGRVANYRKALHELARGQWVIMLDGDDYLTDTGFVSTAWQLVEAHAGQGVVFVQAGQTCHYRDGSRPDRSTLPTIDGPCRLMDGGEYLRLVYDTGFFSHLGLFYNRRIAIGYDAYRADISSSDMESFLRIALAGRVIMLNANVGCWVQHGANTSSNLPIERVAENVRIFRDIARQAISARVLRRSEITGPLRRHQVHSMTYLYRRALKQEHIRPATLGKLLREIVSIHPSLLLNRRVCRLLFDIARRALRPGSP